MTMTFFMAGSVGRESEAPRTKVAGPLGHRLDPAR